MKYNLLFCYFLMHSLFTKGQITKVDSIYFNQTYVAEQQFVNGSFDSALNTYLNCFSLRRPFCIDLYNAAVCAVNANNIDTAFHLFDSMATRGFGAIFFIKHKLFVRCRENNNLRWMQLLKTATNYKDSLQLKTKEIKHVLDSLYARDQEWNNVRKTVSYCNTISQVLKDSFERSAFTELWNTSKATYDYFQKTGYPSEFEIGPNIIDDTLLSNLPVFWVNVVHRYQGIGKGDTLFSGMLRTQLYNGKIKPEQFALLQDYGNVDFTRAYYGTSKMYWLINNTIYAIPAYRSGQFAGFIDSCRLSIGLPQIKMMESVLMKWRENSTMRYFILSTKFSKMPNESEDRIKSIIKNFEIVK